MSRICEYCYARIGTLKLLELQCCKRVCHAWCLDINIDSGDFTCQGCKKVLSQQVLDEIRIESYHKTVCGICQQILICRKKISSCDHWFHMDCLARWTMDKNECPVCRVEFSVNGMEQMRVIRRAIERRAMLCFLDEGAAVIKTFPLTLTKYLTRTIAADYAKDGDVVLPNDYNSMNKKDIWWTPERILTTLFLRHEDRMAPTIKNYLKQAIRGMHECTRECEEGLCVVKVWIMDESVNARMSRSRRGQAPSAVQESGVTPKDHVV